MSVTTVTQNSTDSSSQVNRQKKKREIKGMRIENEEVKLSPFVDGMVVYVENPKESYQKKKPKVSSTM